jgi:hypothetical protein
MAETTAAASSASIAMVRVRGRQLGRAGAEPDQHAPADPALVDRDEIAPEHNVVWSRRRLASGPHGRQPHLAQLRYEIGGDLSAQLAAKLDPLRRRRRGAGHLRGERGFGRHLGGICRDIVDDDAIRPGELRALVALALRDLGRSAARHDREQQRCGAGVRAGFVRML